MRVFGYLCLSALFATLATWSIIYFFPSFAYKHLMGNLLFVVVLVTLIGFTKTEPYKSLHVLVAVPLLFVGATVLLTFLSLFLYETAPILLWIFASPMDVLGYYPSGPDMYFPYAAALWFGSMLAIMYGGLWGGLQVRSRRTGPLPEVEA